MSTNMKSEQINELATALSKAQGKMKNARFDKVNPHYRSAYASLASIADAIREPLATNGLSCSQATRMQDGAFMLVTTLMHSSGQWMTSEYPLPLTLKPQELGSALSYARRYSLSAIACIAADEDDDAEGARKTEVRKPPAPKPSLIVTPLVAGWSAANGGMEALEAWWKSLPNDVKKTIPEDERARMKVTAAEVDELAAPVEEEEDVI